MTGSGQASSWSPLNLIFHRCLYSRRGVDAMILSGPEHLRALTARHALEVDISYAAGPGGNVAYACVGAGPRDLLLCENWVTNLEAAWEQPLIERLHRRLARFGRLIVFDKRGTGISDPIPSSSLSMVPTIEEGTNDAVTVLDDLGVAATAVLGTDLGSWTAMQLAAMFPSRVSPLVLVDPLPRMTRTDDYPFGLSSRGLAAYIADVRENYGRSPDSTLLRFLAPDLSGDEHLKRWALRYQRLGMPPGVMLANWEGSGDVDLRPLLASIRVPTLVLEHEEPPFRSRPGQLVADTIASAVYCEVPGRNAALWAPQPELLFDRIESFITGAVPTGPTESDRFLTTLLFTDVVDSTRLATELGDQEWRERLDLHDATIHTLIEQYRGTMVNHTGDGALASFDGPARAVRCGYALRDRLSAIGLRTRMGVHTGEVERRGENLSGLGVHLAARLLSICEPDELLVTRTVKDLVTGSGIIFEDRGVHAFKGLVDHWQVFRVSQA